MAERVCPWWLGYLLACPLRRFAHNPGKILSPHVRAGMTVLEPGPGMGFFTLDLARLVGPDGRVIAVDLQPKMIASLRRRAANAGLLGRIETRLAPADSLGVTDLNGKVDFTLAFAVVHELPAAARFFPEAFAVSKPGAAVLLAEPQGHVNTTRFSSEVQAAVEAGFVLEDSPLVRRSHAALFRKPAD